MDKKSNIATIDKDINIIPYDIEDIKERIYTVRGKQVMLDSDVAILYHYETRRINEAVKRNIGRFPEDFCFKLTNEEYIILKSQIATSNIEENIHARGGKKKIPYVFTEKGIIMLSGLLKNDIAVEVSIKIVEAFIQMRNFINNNRNLLERVISIENNVDKKFNEYDNKFEQIFNKLQKDIEFKQKIFFKGQIYDAYELIIDIVKTAQNKIVIIDNYIDDTILKMLQKKNKSVQVIILTSQKCNLTKLDIKKFNEQYGTLKIARTDKFHDRFIIIDNKELYHCGASLKDLGKKCFGINKIEGIDFIENINKTINF